MSDILDIYCSIAAMYNETNISENKLFSIKLTANNSVCVCSTVVGVDAAMFWIHWIHWKTTKKCDSDHSFIILVIMSAQVTALSPSRKMKRSGMIHSKELCGDNIEIRFTISDATLLIPLFSMCI